MYESPINVMIREMAEQAAKQLDEGVFSAVQCVMPTVDKDELTRALRYDRNQYDKGHADGKADAMAELVRCKDCKHYRTEKARIYLWNGGHIRRCPCEKVRQFRGDDDFCSCGKRKDGGNDA